MASKQITLRCRREGLPKRTVTLQITLLSGSVRAPRVGLEGGQELNAGCWEEEEDKLRWQTLWRGWFRLQNMAWAASNLGSALRRRG